MSDAVISHHIGLLDYRAALALQQELHAKVSAGDPRAHLIFVEHPPVLTLGKNADARFLLFGEDYFKARGIDVVSIDRGGEVTAHEPGQLVIYPILKLEDFRLAPKAYVNLLEGVVIDALAGFGVEAWRDPEHPGVWTKGGKICAIGIRVKARATLHGIAINVVNSLGLFQEIVPCGIQGRAATSLEKELGQEVPVARVAAAVEALLAERLSARCTRPEASSPSASASDRSATRAAT